MNALVRLIAAPFMAYRRWRNRRESARMAIPITLERWDRREGGWR